MSTPDSQALRDGIRSGAIRCRSRAEGGRCDPRTANHEPGCPWNRAVVRIYEIERAAEDRPHDDVVDWPALLHELRRMGFSLETIASHTRVSRQAVSSYLSADRSPTHSHGERIVNFWLQATGKSRADILRRPPALSAAAFR